MFKRRTPKSWALWFWHLIWPQGGWARAFYYVQHRVRRLPDSPQRIARGIFVGVFTTFTPFYGLHFVVAACLARLANGNILAALMSTFFGNPLTYLPIGIISLETGNFLLGKTFEHNTDIGERFGGAARDLWQNFKAAFTSDIADWTRLSQFYDDIFLPYLIGGIAPGLIAGAICYWLSLPVITAYQRRRKGAIKARIEQLRHRTHKLKPPKDQAHLD